MAANMYRVGDCVYFETSSSEPYQVRRIEELNKTSSGAVEARVRCFYRRRDLPASLIKQAERCYGLAWEEEDQDDSKDRASEKDLAAKESRRKSPETGGAQRRSTSPRTASNISTVSPDGDGCAEQTNGEVTAKSVTEVSGDAASTTTAVNGKRSSRESDRAKPSAEDRHKLLEHRELFLSRHTETLPATQIRGKCVVTLLCEEAESAECYLAGADRFFYSLVYDPAQKTLRVDEGEMRVGGDYQADVPAWKPSSRPCEESTSIRETLVWKPDNGLDDTQVSRFITLAKSVGTFARALAGGDNEAAASAGLHRTAASASRDSTLQFAYDTLHRCHYSMAEAVSALVPVDGGPVMCCDELEQWSPHESRVFDEAYEQLGKDFSQIRATHLPWKTPANMMEYFYMWKASDRFVRRRRAKNTASESQLKQVYIPQYHHGNNGLSSAAGVGYDLSMSVGEVFNGQQKSGLSNGDRGANSCCNICSAEIPLHSSKLAQCGDQRLCLSCRQYWKRYGAAPLPGSNLSVGSLAAGAAATKSSSNGADGQQVFVCWVAGCRRQFRHRSQLIQHSTDVHRHIPSAAATAGCTAAAAAARVRAGFQMLPTWLMLAARRLCISSTVLRRMARGGTLSATTAAVTAAVTPAVVRQRCSAVADATAVMAACRENRRRRRRQRRTTTTMDCVSRRLLGVQLQRPDWMMHRSSPLVDAAVHQLGAGVTLTRRRPAQSPLPLASSAAAVKRARDSVTITPVPQQPTAVSLTAQRHGLTAVHGRRHKSGRLVSSERFAVLNAGAAAAAAVVGRHDDVVYVAGAALRRRRFELYSPSVLRRICRRPCRQLPAAL